MRYAMGFIGFFLIMGSVGGMERETLTLMASIKIAIIGMILIYSCYLHTKKR